MEKLNQLFDRLFDILPGYIFGLLVFIIGMLGNFIALFLSPEYVFSAHTISDLGHKTGGIYSRMGFIISGIFSIPFIIYLGKTLKKDNQNDGIRKIAIGAGIVSSVCIALSGIFSGINPIIGFLHGQFAFFNWMGTIVFCSLFSYIMLKDSKFSKFQIYYGFLVSGLFVFYIIPYFITIFCAINADICYSFGQSVYSIMPTSEWILMCCVFGWYLLNSSYLLYKKI